MYPSPIAVVNAYASSLRSPGFRPEGPYSVQSRWPIHTHILNVTCRLRIVEVGNNGSGKRACTHHLCVRVPTSWTSELMIGSRRTLTEVAVRTKSRRFWPTFRLVEQKVRIYGGSEDRQRSHQVVINFDIYNIPWTFNLEFCPHSIGKWGYRTGLRNRWLRHNLFISFRLLEQKSTISKSSLLWSPGLAYAIVASVLSNRSNYPIIT
jgi:hypothetical protein